MKSKKYHKTLKKKGKQDRSKATIETILQGAAHVLVKEGYEGTNTNRIAEVAGVSIGSIYQYFSNKESIIEELIELHIQKLMNVFLEKFNTLSTVSLKDGIPMLIRSRIEARSVEPELQRVFDEQLPKVGKLRRLKEYENQAVEMIKDYLQSKKSEVSVKNLEMAAFVSVYAVEGVIQAALYNRQDIRAGGHLENELTNFIVRYLVADNQKH
ncbi:MAG: TetR/AcrR family transcriptional regulator [Gammaproteobacteria bacterium]